MYQHHLNVSLVWNFCRLMGSGFFPSIFTMFSALGFTSPLASNSPFVFVCLRFQTKFNISLNSLDFCFIFCALMVLFLGWVIHWNYIFHTCAFLSYIRYYISRWIFFCSSSWKNACVVLYILALVTHVWCLRQYFASLVYCVLLNWTLGLFSQYFLQPSLYFIHFVICNVHNIKDSRQIATVAARACTHKARTSQL